MRKGYKILPGRMNKSIGSFASIATTKSSSDNEQTLPTNGNVSKTRLNYFQVFN